MTNNSLASDIYAVGQKMADNLNTMGVSTADVDDGLTTLVGKILDIPTSKLSTSLSISVPLNLEYGDNFNITGALTSSGTGVENALIKLIVGSTVVDSDNTDSNGEVSFTQCPVATGTHTFKLVYEGDITYNGCESSVVTRDVAKETSVLNVTSPVASSSHYTDASVTVTGVLTDNDATPMKNETVKVCDSSDNVLTTFTTGNDGSFTGGVTISTAGACTLEIVYEGDSNYTSSTVSKSITMVAPSLALAKTAGKQILSYADKTSGSGNTEYCTMTATLSASTISGQTIDWYVDGVKDTSATTTTDSNGQASYTYISAGAGDVEIQAKVGIILSETYSIEDCWKYFTETSASISNFQLPSSFKVDCDVVKTGTSGNAGVIHLWQSSNSTVGFGFLDASNYRYDLGYYNGSNWSRQQLGTSSSGQTVSLTLTYDNGVFTLSNGVNSVTLSRTCQNPLSKFEIEHKTGLSFSNVKIKPL